MTKITQMLAEDAANKFLKDYTGYVTKSRVLPYIDGLKPVHKRLLWSFLEVGARKEFYKSSNIIGQCVKYHPHGDISLYKTLANLIRKPNALIIGKGNWGTGLYDSKFAAMRYTECKTSEIFENILDSEFPKLGSMILTYDEKNVEPVIIDTKLPLANIIGISGIGVGLATNCPSTSLNDVISKVMYALDKKECDKEDEYSYGCWEYKGYIYPEFNIIKKDNKDWLQITGVPNGKYLYPIQENSLIRELCSCGQIIIEDLSEINKGKRKVDFRISGPYRIFDMIIKMLRKSIPKGFSYYNKRVRMSDYYPEWVDYRLEYLKRKMYYEQIKEINKNLINLALSKAHIILESSSLKGSDGFQKIINSVGNEVYDSLRKKIDPYLEYCENWVDSREDFIALIKSKNISSFKNYEVTDKEFKVYTEDDCKDRFVKEIEQIDKTLYGYVTKKIQSLPKITVQDIPIKRYVTARSNWNQIEVQYRQISRMNNWITEGDILVIFEDGSTEKLKDNFFGIYSNDQKKVVGFTFPDEPTVFVTETNSIFIYKRFSKVNELIKQAFTAKYIEINGKKIKVAGGQSWQSVKDYKILTI